MRAHPDARFRNAELMTFRGRQAEKRGSVFRRSAARALRRREFAVQSGAG